MYREVIVYRCEHCGRILTTQKGMESHKKTCKKKEKPIDGQMSFFDKHSQEADV